jgi:hypothetical protein
LILKLINVAMASGLRSRSIDLIRLTQPHGINAAPPSAGRMNAGKQEEKKFARQMEFARFLRNQAA